MFLSEITSLRKAARGCVVIYAVIFTLTLFPRLIKAQSSQFRFKHLTVDEGLSHTDANYIAQDSKGFIWIATYFGLNRYDGYTVKKFYNNNEPVNNAFKNRIRCLFAGDRNQIWLGTEGGIQRFDPGTESYIDYHLTGTASFTAEKIWMPDGRMVYILAGGRLLKFQVNGHALVLCSTNITEANTIYDFNPISADKLLVATKKGVRILNLQGAALKVSFDRLLPISIQCLFTDHQNNLILAGKDHIYSAMRQTGGRPYVITDSVSVPGHNSVTQIAQDATGDFWVQASPVILRLDRKLKLKQVIKAGQSSYDLNSASLSGILIDRSQCLWVATFGKGVNYCDLNQKQFHTLQHNPENVNSLSGNYVRSVLAEKHTLWIGTMDHGLNRYGIASQTFSHFTSTSPQLKLKSDNALSLAMDKKKRLWIGSYAGIQIIDPVTLRDCPLIGEKEFPHFMIETLAEDCFGNMWFGNHTNPFGVIWKDDHNAYHVRYLGEGYFILPDKNKPEIIVSSTHGLDRYQIHRYGQILKTISYRANGTKNFLSSNYTYPISKQNDSVYWIGTIGGGLNRLTLLSKNRYHIEQYNRKFDIFKDVEAMETDQQGNVWMGGNGLEFLNLSKRTLVKFNKNDGLQGNSFKVGSSFKGEDGKLYFGGIDGLTFFDPKEIVMNKIPAKPIITDILINNEHSVYAKGHQSSTASTEALMNGNLLSFNYLQNNFVISFSAMHFANALKCRYRYKLVGYDKSWIYTDGSKPSAFYSNLDYNDYKFVVQATNNDGLWSRDEAALSLTITPPWWKSTPAKTGYAVLFLSILAGIYVYQARWYRLKNDLAVRQVDEARREEIHRHREELYQQQLMFFTNISHEFRTPLTLIIGPLEALIRKNEDSMLQSSYQMMLKNARRLINLITELMNFKKIADSVIKLRVHQSNIKEFCEGIVAEFEDIAEAKQISLHFEDITRPELVAGTRGLFDIQILEKILYNLLNNAFKYTNEGGTVSFKIFSDLNQFKPEFKNQFKLLNEDYTAENYIYFLVADSGIGISEESISEIFDRYYRVNNNHLGSGIGLALVKSLTQLHKGNIYVYSEKTRGTEIIIAIPWGEKNYTAEEKIGAADQSAQLEMVDQSVFTSATPENKTLPDNLRRKLKTILIVDDNQELRLFLSQVLEKEYRIVEAENGQTAIDITLREMPDLIISDVMMPLMNGIEFCKSIKERFETRHLPLILLSAKDGLDTKIAGMESGADFYFAKPLSIELLLLTIHNILLRYSVLKEIYTNNYLSEATELVSSEKDKEFMKKLLNIIEENIEDSELDVDFLCRHIYISRTKLYQKIKSISDQSVAEFIRTVRLKRSIYIMTHEDITMSEVADRVGLQSSSNFSRAFKKEYGKSPMQFMQSFKKNQTL
jgi:signal transduction histidine kinase/DNA-binding response OmpR family regulator/ligand-binding sensor domain-containing protein